MYSICGGRSSRGHTPLIRICIDTSFSYFIHFHKHTYTIYATLYIYNTVLIMYIHNYIIIQCTIIIHNINMCQEKLLRHMHTCHTAVCTQCLSH